MKKLWPGIALSSLAVILLVGSILAQTLTKEKAPLTLTVKGKIIYSSTTRKYVIRTRNEVYSIVNQNAEILSPLAKSGKSVAIQGHSLVGDALVIDKIDGLEYQGSKGKKAK